MWPCVHIPGSWRPPRHKHTQVWVQAHPSLPERKAGARSWPQALRSWHACPLALCSFLCMLGEQPFSAFSFSWTDCPHWFVPECASSCGHGCSSLLSTGGPCQQEKPWADPPKQEGIRSSAQARLALHHNLALPALCVCVCPCLLCHLHL